MLFLLLYPHTHFFPELFKTKLQTWCPFAPKYFRVYFLKATLLPNRSTLVKISNNIEKILLSDYRFYSDVTIYPNNVLYRKRKYKLMYFPFRHHISLASSNLE